MKQSIARVLRRLANRFDPYAGHFGQVAAIGVCGLLETFIPNAPLDKSWMTKIAGGIAASAPALPNAAGAPAIKAPWWRRLLRRFGR